MSTTSDVRPFGSYIQRFCWDGVVRRVFLASSAHFRLVGNGGRAAVALEDPADVSKGPGTCDANEEKGGRVGAVEIEMGSWGGGS